MTPKVTPDPVGGPVFFASPGAFGKWLAAHHATHEEVLVGYHKVHTGKPSLTWAQSVEEALRWGWIDGIRRSAGPEAYTIRFTPRRPGSHWSAANVRTAQRLIEEGRMRAAGRRAFEARSMERTARASFEQGHLEFDAAQRKAFRASPGAWRFFEAQPATYRRAVIWWVQSAKQPATQQRRLASAIAHSAGGQRLPQFTRRVPKAG